MTQKSNIITKDISNIITKDIPHKRYSPQTKNNKPGSFVYCLNNYFDNNPYFIFAYY